MDREVHLEEAGWYIKAHIGLKSQRAGEYPGSRHFVFFFLGSEELISIPVPGREIGLN